LIRVHLCGRLTVELEGRRVEGRLRGRQGRQLFAYLVVNRSRAVPRDELIDAIWPFGAPPRPGATLSTLLSLLRRELGAERVVGRSEVQLELPGDAWVDVEAAAEAAARAEAAIARGEWDAAWTPSQVALTIAERGFLPGHDAPWIDTRRRDLDDLLLDALELVAVAGMRVGGSELAAAERAARRLVELAPMRESGHAALMEVQEARGNVGEALRTYEDLRCRLRDELGAAPGAGVQRIHRRLLAASGDTGAPEPVQGPPPGEAPSALPPLIAGPAGGAFLGRRRELARLELMLERARELPRQLALVAGEPGMGKTRLLTEFGRIAHAAGALTLFGRADEAGLVPFGPFVEALRHHVAHAPPGRLARAAALGAGELAELLPELPPEDRGSGSRDPALARYRLFDAFSALLVDAGSEGPVVLLLDDLQWADEPTLLLLAHVLRAAAQQHLLVVGSYRDAELHRAKSLADTLADLRRDIPVERLTLRGLARDDVGMLARATAGREAPESVVRSIHEETEGNPFFVLEMTRHLSEAADDGELSEREGLPDSVREVILRRLGHLSESTQGALRVAAAVGREFDLDVVEQVAGLDAEALLAAVEEAEAARVVSDVPDRPERYSFAHALIRATLYAELSPARRIRMHEGIGRALGELRARGRPVAPAELAGHLLAALPRGDAAAAVDAAMHAATESTASLAYEDAARHLRQALAALDRHLPEDVPRRARLLVELGHAERRSGRMPEARTTFTAAIDSARTLADPDLLAEAVLGYGGGGFESAFVDETIVELLEEALDGLDPRDGIVRVELLSRLAKALYYSEREDDEQRRATLSGEAMAMAERIGDDRAMLVALEGRHFALTSPENLDERLATASRTIELAGQVGDRERDLLGRYFLIADLVEADRMEDADREIALYGRLADEARMTLHRWYHARFLAMRALLRGRLDEAAALAERAFELGLPVEPRTATMHFGTQTWMLHWLQGDLAKLEEPVRGFVAEYPRVPAWRAGLALVLLAQGRRDEAGEVFREFTASGFRNIPRDAIWSLTAALAADLVVAGLGDMDDARTLYELMLPYADRNAVTGEVIIVGGPLALYVGRLALVLGETTAAVALLESARERALRMEAAGFAALAEQALAQAVPAA
jgi:DNA-binding SARP family transcriptional activator/tetratricopeptide (TPR) repeat protein